MPAKKPVLYGRLTPVGLIAALLALALDQGSKVWLLWGFDLPAHYPVPVGPFLDLVVVWNTGISYGLFPQTGPLGQWALLAVKVIAVLLLWVWLARVDARLTAVSLGLIIGGAIGNAIDRATLGAVFDFVLLHATIAGETWSWYVFNLADVAIVAGVIGLVYETVWPPDAVKAP